MAKTVKDEQKPATTDSLGGAQKSRERYSTDRKPDGTIAIKIVVPASDAEKVREKIVDEFVKQVEIQGFRKGAAPRKLAEQKLNQESVKEEVLKKVLTDEYLAAVKDSGINPIVNPRIHVEQFAEGTDLIFEAETCESPDVNLKNYKEEVHKIKPASPSLGGPAPKIVIPGKAASAEGSGEPKDEPSKKLDEILAVILNVVEIQIPQILIDQETDRLLSQLVDEIKRLGVSLDQYLSSRGKTAEQLRTEYSERAEKDLKLEFMLRKIADEEKITVEQKDIEQAVGAIKDETERKKVSENPYLVAAIIRQQKTLEFLTKI